MYFHEYTKKISELIVWRTLQKMQSQEDITNFSMSVPYL